MTNIINYNPICSTNLTQAIRTSLDLVQQNPDSLVSLIFNGITVPVVFDDNVDTIKNRRDKLKEEKAIAYRASQEYLAEVEAFQENIRTNQRKLDFLLERLNQIKNNEKVLVNWLSEFAKIANNSLLIWDKRALAIKLASFNYTVNAFIDLPKEAYYNKTIMAGYIIGQAIDHLNKDLPPHEILCDFVNYYNELL